MALFSASCAACGVKSSSLGFFNLCDTCRGAEENRQRTQFEKMEAAARQQARDAMLQAVIQAQTLPGVYLPLPSTPILSAAKPLTSAGMKVEDLIGWRIWKFRNGYLTAFSRNYVWLPGEVEEGTPGDRDAAGIWAFKTRRRAIIKLIETSAPHVWGSIRMWGSVVEHNEGFRASKARIVSLDGATDQVSDEAFARLCRRYGVPGAECGEPRAAP